MPPGYSAQQKAAVSQFMSFANTDRNTAIRYLKSANWDPTTAVNTFFGSGGVGAGQGNSSAVKANLTKLFDTYREDVANAPDSVGPDGSMRYFQTLGIDLEGLDVLVVSEIIQAPTMAEMSRQGFVDGWAEAGCDTIDKQKAYLKSLKQRLPSNKEAFAKVYKYTFTLGKAANQKAVPLDVAITYWELLFTSPLAAVRWKTPSTPWITWWSEFLNSQWKKSVNRDMWNETLRFAQLTLEDEAISFWNEESSWPSVIDDFVAWVKKEKRGGEPEPEVMEY
ncbi:DUF298-domain-containing protein [Byssothecium circinans]|uniref:Defective in cullin neddylation protein n=1 Tax=Byssothecium circinans TaxID=147558 RepID=A0A6A5U0V4_9PLEO|nr:DUF298-domain-containing protein [Byssothecium circinans]